MSDNQEFEMPQDALAHYGVKGMKWGVRNSDRPAGTSRRTDRDARKDAKEFARAKMFYGEGAGTRRKLINNSVAAKSSRSPSYKEAFDRHLANQDLSKHADKARSERRRKDVTQTTAKTARGVHRQLTGGFGSVSLASAILAGGYLYAKRTGTDRVLKNYADKAWRDLRNSKKARQNMADAINILRNSGL